MFLWKEVQCSIKVPWGLLLYFRSGLVIGYFLYVFLGDLFVSRRVSLMAFCFLNSVFFCIICGWVGMGWQFASLVGSHLYSFATLQQFVAEPRGQSVYLLAKYWHGHSLLQQSTFDEGTSENVQVISDEIIDRALELMMNPFWLVLYAEQKLLDVRNEEKMQILMVPK